MTRLSVRCYETEQRTITKTPPRQKVFLDEFDPALNFSLRLGPIGPTKARLVSPVPGKILEDAMQNHGPALPLDHHRLRVVLENLFRDAPK